MVNLAPKAVGVGHGDPTTENAADTVNSRRLLQHDQGLSHHIVEQWDVDDTTIVQTEATYTRPDDRRVTVPAITVYRRGGDLIDEYRIFVDLSPVYA
jgi:hypothetical protein